MKVQFDCTQCGKCCHNLKLPLSVEEAIRWSRQGHRVQFLCDALPDLGDPDPADVAAHYRHQRSFAAMSGGLSVRVHAILVASHDGPCPHLQADMRCGDYEERPRVCRIYPAEIAPHVPFDPDIKQCPPEAWDVRQPLFLRDGRIVSDETVALIEAHRRTTRADTPIKATACELLGLNSAALGNEGYVVHSPEPAVLVEILELACSAEHGKGIAPAWSILTNRRPTFNMLEDAGARSTLCKAGADYIAFFADES